jgi:hypothetical protein
LSLSLRFPHQNPESASSIHHKGYMPRPSHSSRFYDPNNIGWGVVSTSPNPQAGEPPLVGCPRLLIKYIRSYPPYWKPFLRPQPDDAPC